MKDKEGHGSDPMSESHPYYLSNVFHHGAKMFKEGHPESYSHGLTGEGASEWTRGYKNARKRHRFNETILARKTTGK